MSFPVIDVSHLTREFGTLRAVNDVSFQVNKGEIFAFLGPNGAGKSTTIKMLTTLLKPTAGSVYLNKIDSALYQAQARRVFGIVFQDPSLDDDLTAMENLQLHAVLYNVPVLLRKQRIQEMLEFVELWERKDHLVKTFSGGMKRRLEIARGLLHHPKILFLDEPTIGLDPQTRNHMWQYLQAVNQKEQMTIFFTTHYMEEAEKIAQKIAVIDHGKIIAMGTTQQLTKQTQTKTLEDAFLVLTGRPIREEEASSLDHLRMRRKLFHR